MAIDGPTARSWTFLALILSGIFMHKLYLTSRSCKTPHKYALASESIATFKFQHEALVNLTVLVDKVPTFFSPLLNYSIALKLKITRVLSCGLRPSWYLWLEPEVISLPDFVTIKEWVSPKAKV
jgi:hypothetical protein